MLSGVIGGILGLIGVAISLIYSFKLNKQNQQFQKEMAKKPRIQVVGKEIQCINPNDKF